MVLTTEAEVDWFYEDLQHFLEHQKQDVLFIIGCQLDIMVIILQ